MVMPYLNFSGKCEEAFRWYADIFGGTINHLVTYRQMPYNPQMPLSQAQKEMVMHGQVMLTAGGGISGCDSLWPVEGGAAVNIHVHMDSEEKAREVFAALASEGTVIGPLAVNPPPDDSGMSGMVKDRYGFCWVISAVIK